MKTIFIYNLYYYTIRLYILMYTLNYGLDYIILLILGKAQEKLLPNDR